jgi:hypothetical protein
MGVALSLLLDQLKYEAGISPNVAHGVQQRDAYVYLLNRVQKELVAAHNWPFLKVTRDVTTVPGERFYEFPEDMDFESINEAYNLWGNTYHKLCYGIEPEDLNVYGASETLQSDPIQKWMVYPDNTRQFEVWPSPATASTVRFRGRLKVRDMVADADQAVIDGTLIVLFAAAEILAKQKSADAQIKLQKAQSLLTNIKRQQGADKRKPAIMGGGTEPERRPRIGLDYIPWGYGNGQ